MVPGIGMRLSPQRKNVFDEQPGTSIAELTLEVGRIDGRVVVRLCGDLDAYSAPALRRTLVDLIDGQGNCAIVVDLAHLDFMGAAGMGVLAAAGRDVRARGGQIALYAPSRAVLRILHITGLDSSFLITGDLKGEVVSDAIDGYGTIVGPRSDGDATAPAS